MRAAYGVWCRQVCANTAGSCGRRSWPSGVDSANVQPGRNRDAEPLGPAVVRPAARCRTAGPARGRSVGGTRFPRRRGGGADTARPRRASNLAVAAGKLVQRSRLQFAWAARSACSRNWPARYDRNRPYVTTAWRHASVRGQHRAACDIGFALPRHRISRQSCQNCCGTEAIDLTEAAAARAAESAIG